MQEPFDFMSIGNGALQVRHEVLDKPLQVAQDESQGRQFNPLWETPGAVHGPHVKADWFR